LAVIDFRGGRVAAPRTAVPGRRWMLPASSLPVLAIAALYLAIPAPQDAPAEIDLTALAAAAASVAPAAPQDLPQNIEVTVQRNDTLDRIFRSVGIDNATLAELRTVPDARRALDMLRPGDTITLTHVDGVLQALNRRISNTLTLSVARGNDGFAVDFIENPLEVEVTGARARIETSLFDAGRAAGMSAQTVMVLANEIFGWDIDFANDIRAGDAFSVLYQRKFQDGAYVTDGRVLAAEFSNRGKTYHAVWFESADGIVKGYYSPEGKGMRKAFLRAPLDFARVSSGFNPKRRHPISGKVRAHRGIDFAAPTGTPIYAAGDGRIEFAGRKGGYGNAVVINHGKGTTTLYAHMSRFGKSARGGRRVRQGEVIGYVGSTGASTGPHLHYEYRVKGVHKNPASIPLPNTEIDSRYLAEFRAQAQVALAQLRLANSAPGERLADNR
jgi:murein DD-endopeptidase MepM/ murein hydrolase activator NlpD